MRIGLVRPREDQGAGGGAGGGVVLLAALRRAPPLLDAHGITSLAGNLDSNGKCTSNPLTYFNIISDLEAGLGVRIYESS